MELSIPSWDEYFMRNAYLIATKSKDLKTKIGTVLVKNKNIISTGYNGLPRGIDDTVTARLERPLKYLWTAHSEFNSICNCARNGINSCDSTCYTIGLPCNNCCLSLIQGGVTEIVIHKQWEDRSGLLNNPKWTESCNISLEMIKESNIKLRYLDLELNVKGMCDGKIFTV